MEINVTSSLAPSPTPTSSGSSFLPWTVSPTVPTATKATNETQVPSLAPVELQKEAIPVLFDLIMESSATASLHQLSKDVDGLLEDYLFRNLKSRQGDEWDVRDVLLTVTITTRRRRLQGTREVALRVDGDVLVDVDATTSCAECADQAIQADLDELVTVEALDAVVVRSLQDVTRVKEVRAVAPDQGALPSDSSNSFQATTSEGEQLQRPSTLSIVFGFTLTGIAFLGLVFYAYIFYRKRQKQLKKQRQQLQSIEYRLPPSRVTPVTPPQGPPPNKQRISPSVVPTSASTPARDDSSITSTFKVVVDTDTVASEAQTDDFARELELAATLDEQAWEDFQRKKMALDHNKQLPPPSFSTIGSVSPIPVPVPAPESNPQAWTKSFPYGDEVPEEQGVEWIPETTAASPIEGKAWLSYEVNNKVLQPQENKQGNTTSKGRRDPEPTVLGPSSAVLQSIGKTLSYYPDPNNENSVADESFLTEDESEFVDEVARLTRYVQRLEKQKERRIQLETSRQVTPSMGIRQQPDGSNSRKYTENNGYLNNMRSPPTHGTQYQRPLYESSIKPGPPRYTGITMAGGLYQDPSMIILDPADSMSEGSEENQSLRSHERLGITPFSVQNSAAVFQAYNSDPISPSMTNKGREGGPVINGRSRQIFPIDNTKNNPSIVNRGARNPISSQPPSVRLSDLRTNQAIIDETQSDANFVTFSDAGSDPISPAPRPRPTQPTTTATPTSRNSFFNPPSNPRESKPTNQKFSKLRSLFEERPKNAVFPPDENWQSNGMLKT